MDDQAFRRERLLASGLLREVTPGEEAALWRFMAERAAPTSLDRPPPMPRPPARAADRTILSVRTA
ncbi:hypothetical protein [Falsiroseomonas selenitidurans]|uniref:Uncharacterized protein n=1 Tax=Falsiroseomonas selenitidurans TaxID=2716335 RepID=A0ABX1DXU8_9PROT|nr:hypothetical protein [Falsiroseomonas selenitidurans]NKC29323.1 hypothetical protein [Falsiroseomonas selenitidurans]